MSRRGDGADPKIDLEALDLERYDFPGLRAEINDIVDLPSAVARTARWAVLLTLAGAFLTWLVFRTRMPGLVLVPYLILMAAALAVAAIAVGVTVVLRARVASTRQAADRVVGTVASLHGDYLRIRTGEVDLPMRAMASLLTRELVFPALLSSGSNLFATATTTTGPVGLLLRLASRPVLGVIEDQVLDALDGADPEAAEPSDLAHPDAPRPATDVVADLEAELPPELFRWYRLVHARLRQIGGLADTVTNGSTTGLVVLAALPAAALLAIGWSLT